MTSILKSCLAPSCSLTMDTSVGMPAGHHHGGRAFDEMKAHVQKSVSFDLSKNTFADDQTEYTYGSTVYSSDSSSSEESSFGSYDCGTMLYSTAAGVVATTTTNKIADKRISFGARTNASAFSRCVSVAEQKCDQSLCTRQKLPLLFTGAFGPGVGLASPTY